VAGDAQPVASGNKELAVRPDMKTVMAGEPTFPPVDHRSCREKPSLTHRKYAVMPIDPALLARLQTLCGEPVNETTAEADSEAAFVPFEWQPSLIPPTEAVQGPTARSADDPATWNAPTAELIDWLRANRDRLPSEPFDRITGSGVWVSDLAKFYLVIDANIQGGANTLREKGCWMIFSS